MDDTFVSDAQDPTRLARRAWLLLIHQLPTEPAYLRVKVSRQLRAIGAVALKNSVYVLPEGAGTREDFHWLRRAIVDGGGEATLSVVEFLEGTRDDELLALFEADRGAEYDELAEAARAVTEAGRAGLDRLRRRLEEIVARDHFGSPSRAAAEAALAEASARLRGEPEGGRAERVERPRGATWVTRAGVFVDRMASAWLIGRFIDPDARFRFVAEESDAGADELRFDMFEGGFTHEGDRCTFETLLDRFGLQDAALRAIAEIVHDIDMKDGRYERPETAGVAGLVRGVAAGHAGDDERIAAAVGVFDALYEHFRAGAA